MTSASVAAKESSPIAGLRSAIVAQRIYPSGSAIVERALAHARVSLESFLRDAPRLTLTDRGGRITVNGKEDAEANALSSIFQEQGIQSLTILEGVSEEELASFVRVLGQRRGGGRKLAEALVEERLEHIQVDNVTLVEIEDGEVVTRKLNVMFDKVQDFPGLMGSLRESFEVIGNVSSLSQRNAYLEKIGARLAVMPSHLLKDLFENPLPKAMEDAGIRETTLKNMTAEKIHGVLSEIGQWYEGIRRTSSSDFEALDKLNQLKSFLGKLLGSPASRNVPFAVYEELLRKGLIDSIPPDVAPENQEDSLPVQVDRLMGKPPAALLESPVREGLPVLFGKLCSLQLVEEARGLLGKLLNNLDQESSLLRRLAVETGRDLLSVLGRSRQPGLGDHLFEALRRMADGERVKEVYEKIAGTLAEAAFKRVVDGKPVAALEIIAQLRLHEEMSFPFLPDRPKLARSALTSLARRSMDVLLSEMSAGVTVQEAAARNVLFALGAAAAPCLVEMIKREDNIRLRRSAALSLKEMGAAGEEALAAEMTMGAASPVLLNLLSVAEEFSSPAMVRTVKNLRAAPDPFVRRRLVRFLTQIDFDESREELTAYLEDADESVRLEAIRSAGDLALRRAVPFLRKALNEGGTLQREEACIALGKIADDSVVPALVDILSSRGGLFSRRKETEETVRVRAAWALASVKSFLGRQELKKFVEDENPQVALIARETEG